MSAQPSSPRTVLQISAEYPPAPGGVGDYTRLLCRELMALGMEVEVLTGMSGHGSATASAPGEPRVEAVTDGRGWRSTRRLLRAVASRQPDVVHIQYQTGAYGMHPAINFLPRRLRRLAHRPRVVVTMHDLRVPYLLPKVGPLRRWVTSRLVQGADAVVVTNDADQQILAGALRPDNPDLFLPRVPHPTTLIPIGSNVAVAPPADYDRDVWRRGLGVGPEHFLVVFFGLAGKSKGLLDLVYAMAGLPGKAHLLVVGGETQQEQDRAYLAEVRAVVERLELQSQITFTGYCDAPDVSAHLLAADAGALPFLEGASYRRGSLLALLAHGVPLVTTRSPWPLNPPLGDGEQALLIAPQAINELRDALERIRLDQRLRERLRDGACALHCHFTWPAIAAAHVALYTDLRQGAA